MFKIHQSRDPTAAIATVRASNPKIGWSILDRTRKVRTARRHEGDTLHAMPPPPSDSRSSFAAALVDQLLSHSMPPDPAVWAPFLYRDVHLRVADRPTVIGADRAVAELAILFRPILCFGSCYHLVWAAPDHQSVVVETDLVNAAASSPLPAAIIFRLLGRTQPIRDLRFYLNLSPLDLAHSAGGVLCSTRGAFRYDEPKG